MELPQHSLGCDWRLVRELRDRVQTVEQEVRLKLKTKKLELGARELHLEHVRANRSVTVLSMKA